MLLKVLTMIRSAADIDRDTLEQRKKAAFRRQRRSPVKLPSVVTHSNLSELRSNNSETIPSTRQRPQQSLNSFRKPLQIYIGSKKLQHHENSGEINENEAKKTSSIHDINLQTAKSDSKFNESEASATAETDKCLLENNERLPDSTTAATTGSKSNCIQQSLAAGIKELIIVSQLKNIKYDFKKVTDVPMVVNRSHVRLPVLVSLDRKEHQRLEGAHVLINIIGRAFQAFDNALKIILDNALSRQSNALLRILCVTTKLALCHAKDAARTGKLSGKGPSLEPTTHDRALQLGKVALNRSTELQDILLPFSAQHMVCLNFESQNVAGIVN